MSQNKKWIIILGISVVACIAIRVEVYREYNNMSNCQQYISKPIQMVPTRCLKQFIKDPNHPMDLQY